MFYVKTTLMFKRLIKYLYFKYFKPDFVAMTRQQLGLFNKGLKIEELKEELRQSVYQDCESYVREGSTLNVVLDNLSEKLVVAIATTTPNTPIQVTHAELDRFTINGLFLLKETLLGLASQAQRKTEPFNPHEPL